MDFAKIVRLVGLLFAIVAALVTIPETALILALLGLVAGWFVEEERRIIFLLFTVTLGVVHGALSPLPVVGGYITDILLANVSALVNAAAITVIATIIFERVKP